MGNRISGFLVSVFTSSIVFPCWVGGCSPASDGTSSSTSGGSSAIAGDGAVSSVDDNTASGGSTTGSTPEGQSPTGGSTQAVGGAADGGRLEALTGGSSTGTGGSGAPTGGSSATGGAPATGGTTVSTGGASTEPAGGGAASGGSGEATGGTSAASGGTEIASGGVDASTGGSDVTTGGTEVAAGGEVASGGSEATGGAESSTGGVEEPYVPVVIGSERTGKATYYYGSGVVNCSYEGITDDMLIAALNTTDYGNADWCGACARVQGPNGEVIVRIVDSCPSCGAGDLDLSPTAFDLIADRIAGRVDINWTFVSCDVTGPLTYFYKEGSSEGWTAILVENHRLPITKMEWSKNQSDWTAMQRQTYNYFLEAAGFGVGGAYVRLTAPDGQQLVDRLPPSREYVLSEGDGNFE